MTAFWTVSDTLQFSGNYTRLRADPNSHDEDARASDDKNAKNLFSGRHGCHAGIYGRRVSLGIRSPTGPPDSQSLRDERGHARSYRAMVSQQVIGCGQRATDLAHEELVWMWAPTGPDSAPGPGVNSSHAWQCP